MHSYMIHHASSRLHYVPTRCMTFVIYSFCLPDIWMQAFISVCHHSCMIHCTFKTSYKKFKSLIKSSNPVTSIPLRFISVSICKQMSTRLWIHALADTSACHSFTALWPLSSFSGQALDLLVLLSSMHYCTSTRSLSTSSSSRGLTSFEWDILSWGGLHA